MTVPEQTEQRDSTAPETPIDPTAWGARFGWIIGAIVGLGVGFVGTYLVETVLFRSKPNAIEQASRVARYVFSACFLLGALAGHYLGARGGARWYKPLGITAGILLLALGWVLLSIAR